MPPACNTSLLAIQSHIISKIAQYIIATTQLSLKSFASKR